MILGVDPGTINVGWAVLYKNGKRKNSGVIHVVGKKDMSYRLYYIRTEISRILTAYPIETVCIEDGYAGPNPRTTARISEARGAIISECYPREVIMVDPSEAKKAVAGTGKIDKADMLKPLRELLGEPGFCPDRLDESDAVAVALCGRDFQKQRKKLQITDKDRKTFITRQEAAQWAGVSPSTIDRWGKTGKLKREGSKYSLASLKSCLKKRQK